MGKLRAAIITLIVLAFFFVGLSAVNLRVAVSATTVESNFATGSSTPGADRGKSGIDELANIIHGPLFVYVEGEDTVTEAVRREIVTTIRAEPRFGQVALLPGPPKVFDHPALVLDISEHRGLWTPLYSNARLEVRFAYASDRGDISWRDEGQFVFNGDEPKVRVRGEITVTDETRGLNSKPAYAEHLGKEIAQRVSKDLAQALDNATKANRP